MGNMGLSFEFIDGLNVRVDGGIDYNQNNRNFFRPSTMDVSKMNENYIEEGITRNIFMQGEALLNYRFSIREKHNFGYYWEFLWINLNYLKMMLML